MKKKVKVIFYPKEKIVEVDKGTNLWEAANQAGVYINSVCGGDGICGKCRLILKKGAVQTKSTTLLTRDEVKKGYILACQTRVEEDVIVEVPVESRQKKRKILVDKDAGRFRALHPSLKEKVHFKYEPLVQKMYLALARPSIHDNLSDHVRLYRYIQRKKKIPVMQSGLKVIRSLPELLRKNDWKITVTLGMRGGTIEVIQLEGGDTTGENYAVVIDVGTSTVVAHLIDLNTCETIDAEATYNSQKVYGEEVTRRIIYAEQNRLDKLREVVVSDINNLITALVTRSKVRLNDIMAILCAGNTAMVHFLLGFNPSRIRKEPYIPVCISPPPIRAVEIGVKVNPRGLLYCLPSIASWVGADITAGILATGLYRAKDLTMLIDIGTNGEIVIGNREWMVCCSASAGPAFEGSGVKCGMRAAEGAIEKVSIRSGKDIKYTTIGDSRPMGICGSGLIDLIAELFTAGFIDRSGRLDLSRDKRIRERDGEAEFVLVPAQHSATGEDIVITQPDIDSLVRAKAAIFAAVNILIGSLNLEFEDIRRIYLAGGFGNYLDRKKALTIGLIPDLPLERIQFVGNTSIMGAKIAMLSQEALETCYEISRKITYYDLITHSNYMDEFMSAKFLPHTDLDKFPDVSVLKIGGVKNCMMNMKNKNLGGD
ncbi:DUF4445 domain-containing protein [Candidatus Aerophobetes bacterium]|uniref:DUF4445 domain-containing protein n=1 Tax=Aerophobetes bacterium TaxID=2030807 RepID=A0A523ZHZ5_UNCAE|nr:MAG: DUF4445 domain-containing protein [Candidatus Aerophobetes bacterium]